MKNTNIIIGRFQPLTLGHIKCAKEGYNINKTKSILCVINTPEDKRDKKHPFSTESLMPIYQATIKANLKYFYEDILLIKSANFVEIFKELNKLGYNPIAVLCGTDRYAAYLRQANKYMTMQETYIKCIEIKRANEDISATQAREALLKNNKQKFMQLVEIPLEFKLKNIDIFDELKKQLEEI